MRLFRARCRNAQPRFGDGNLLRPRTVANSREGSFGGCEGRRPERDFFFQGSTVQSQEDLACFYMCAVLDKDRLYDAAASRAER